MHVGHCAAGVPHVLLLPTGLYYCVVGWEVSWASVQGRSTPPIAYVPEVCLLGSGPSLRCL